MIDDGPTDNKCTPQTDITSRTRHRIRGVSAASIVSLSGTVYMRRGWREKKKKKLAGTHELYVIMIGGSGVRRTVRLGCAPSTRAHRTR